MLIKDILVYLTVILLGAGVPIVLFIKAFEKVELLSGWAWVGITLVSIFAICCGILILAIRTMKQK